MIRAAGACLREMSYRSVVLSVCLSVTFVHCGQTVGWIKMKLGIVLDGDPAPPAPKGTDPKFSAHISSGQMVAWIKMPLGTEVGLYPDDIVLDGT